MKKSIQYAIHPAEINTRIHCDDPMPGRDETYPDHDEWLRANAKRFYFTDQQIVCAGVKEFPPEDRNYYCGVYFLIQHGEIVYVGQSLTIGRRISEHLHKPDSVAWIETPKWCREYIEAYYIERIGPERNRSIPSGHYFASMVEDLAVSPAESA